MMVVPMNLTLSGDVDVYSGCEYQLVSNGTFTLYDIFHTQTYGLYLESVGEIIFLFFSCLAYGTTLDNIESQAFGASPLELEPDWLELIIRRLLSFPVFYM